MTTSARCFRRAVLCTVVASLSCGPERAPVVDIERIKAEYCEFAVGCVADPGFDVLFCVEKLDEYGIERGGYYDERGCLDEEAAFLACLSGMTCEAYYYDLAFMDEGGPCYDEYRAVYDADCYPATG